jgi:HK97 family phage major capsid protein
MVEDAFMNGDGVGKPLGIINSPALLTVVRDTASQINYEDILNMWARRYIGANDYVWYVAPEAAAQLPQMLNGTIPGYMPPGGISGAQYGTLLGRPVIETEYNPTLNAIGDILLASMGQYQAISKGGVQAASSIHVGFLTDEQVFRFVYRVDGTPMWSSVLTPFNGSALTVTPFVALSAACAT